MKRTAYFSDREDAILKLLSKKNRTIREISQEMFELGVIPKYHFEIEISVGNSIRRIISKCEHYKLDWTLTKKKKDGKLLIAKEKLT